MSSTHTLQFDKWEGLGNDFVIIELPEGSSQPFNPERVRFLCDRHRGIGADGILFIDRSGPSPRMIVSNADGSRPEMCGNGLRCVAAFLASGMGFGAKGAEGDPKPQMFNQSQDRVTLVIATDAGDKRCIVERAPHGEFAVTVDMGSARKTTPLEVAASGKIHTFTTIDVGNPHAITFDTSYSQADIDSIAPTVATALPGGINVEFCHIIERDDRPRIDVTVWERGVGRTLACGTGACAVAAAACDANRIRFDTPVDVALPGGTLEITVATSWSIRMKGPARRVFRGEVAGA
jgi:diaminopimelate epimerase